MRQGLQHVVSMMLRYQVNYIPPVLARIMEHVQQKHDLDNVTCRCIHSKRIQRCRYVDHSNLIDYLQRGVDHSNLIDYLQRGLPAYDDTVTLVHFFSTDHTQHWSA